MNTKMRTDRTARILMFQQLFVIFYLSPQKLMKRLLAFIISNSFLILIIENYMSAIIC